MSRAEIPSLGIGSVHKGGSGLGFVSAFHERVAECGSERYRKKCDSEVGNQGASLETFLCLQRVSFPVSRVPHRLSSCLGNSAGDLASLTCL